MIALQSLPHSLVGFRSWPVSSLGIIGVVAALLGLAGGKFLIPTLVLSFGVDIKLAGSLSLAVSLPTMLVGFARYSRDQSFFRCLARIGFSCCSWRQDLSLVLSSEGICLA